MGSKVGSKDVLDPDAMTQRFFRGRVMGHFERTGPNAWDAYRYVPREGDIVDVLPRLKVQVERWGAEIRMRREGRVVRVRWAPTEEEQEQLAGQSTKKIRAHFRSRYLSVFDEEPGKGAAAVIANKLGD